MPARTRNQFLGSLAAAMLVSSCQGMAAPTTSLPSPTGLEQQPGPGLAAISGDPAMAAEDLVIKLILPGVEVSEWSETISAGEAVKLSTWSLPGTHRLLVNGNACDGSFEVVSDRLTEVTLRVESATCETIMSSITELPSG